MALASSDAVRETKASLGGAHVPTRDLFRLDGRTVLITGGAGAMGLTVAGSVLESGGDAILVDLPEKPPKDAYGGVMAHVTVGRLFANLSTEPLLELAKQHQTKVIYVPADVTSLESMSGIFSTVVSTARYPLRGLVTCAGISDDGPSTDYAVNRFRRVHDVNVTGNFICCQAAAREFTKLGVPGSIVIIASMSGWITNKGVDTAAYNSSKAALHQLTRSLAAEWGSSPSYPLIRVNSLSPGYIRTAATVDALKKAGREEQWAADNMLNRLSEIDEFRAPIMFLLGDGSSFMTAADMRVDGGHCAW